MYNKTILTKIFNVRFKDLLKYIRKKLSDNIYIISQIDTLNNKIKGNGNRTIVHIFVDYVINNKEISKNIKNCNDKFFDDLTIKKYGENKIFIELKNIYQQSNEKDRKFILKEINVLRRLASKYIKVSE